MAEKAAFIEDLIAACRELGQARVVLRNGLGLSETFSELSRLQLGDGWIHLVQEGAHLHLDVTRLHLVRFHCTDETGESRAISLCGEHGCPLVVMMLDQARGSAATAQATRFERLREVYGPVSRLLSAEEVPGGRSDARAADGSAPTSVADGGALWH